MKNATHMKPLSQDLIRVMVAALDSMPHGMAVYDDKGEIMLSNRCFKTFLERYSNTHNLLTDQALPDNFLKDMEEKGSCDFLAFYDPDMKAHPSYAGGPVNRVHTAKVVLDGVHRGYTIAATDATDDERKAYLLNCYARDSKMVLDNLQVGLVCLKTDYTVLWKGIDSIYGKELGAKMYNVGTHCYEHFGATEPCKDCPVTWAMRDKAPKFRVFHDPSNDSYLDVNVTPIYEKEGTTDHLSTPATYNTTADYLAETAETSADATGGKGKIVAYLMELRNVTRREKAMREVEEARNKAQEGERAKTAFLRNMSHEFRTPLNALLGFTEVLCNPEFDKLSAEERQEYRDQIRANSRLMFNMFNDIIDLTNIEAQTLLPKNDSVNVEEIFRDSIIQMHEQTQPGVEMRLNIPEDLRQVTLQSDYANLQRMLCKLLSNACKNTHEGTITLALRCISIDSAKKAAPQLAPTEDVTHYMEISVTDTGAGIPASEHDAIFRPFYKGDHFKPGTGMGLPITIKTAEALGGTLYLDSSYTTGARFVILHPHTNTAAETEATDNKPHTLADVK